MTIVPTTVQNETAMVTKWLHVLYFRGHSSIHFSSYTEKTKLIWASQSNTKQGTVGLTALFSAKSIRLQIRTVSDFKTMQKDFLRRSDIWKKYSRKHICIRKFTYCSAKPKALAHDTFMTQLRKEPKRNNLQMPKGSLTVTQADVYCVQDRSQSLPFG